MALGMEQCERCYGLGVKTNDPAIPQMDRMDIPNWSPNGPRESVEHGIVTRCSSKCMVPKGKRGCVWLGSAVACTTQARGLPRRLQVRIPWYTYHLSSERWQALSMIPEGPLYMVNRSDF